MPLWNIYLSVFLVLSLESSEAFDHGEMLVWCQKESFFGEVAIVSVLGDPDIWVNEGPIDGIGTGAPQDLVTSLRSHRIALAYKYSSRNLFWSDRGLKNIYSVQLEQRRPGTSQNYTANLRRVYHGISSQVNGLAVDWFSNSVYWTDALYNWITVASASDTDVYKHIVYTDLDKPMGIAVHPLRGFLFWSDWGSVPKIERSDLDGSNRKVLVSTSIGRPLGMTIDYAHDMLYWIDDYKDTIEYMNITHDGTGSLRRSFRIHPTVNRPHSQLFGIAISTNFVFVTDQLDRVIRIFDKRTEHERSTIRLHDHVPYDILMYSEDRQQQAQQSRCATLGCQHLCVSRANYDATCLCSEGYVINNDYTSCSERRGLRQPSYIYSAGHRLCSTPIHLGDRREELLQDVDCFIEDVQHVTALAYHSHGELLFYADSERGDIRRHRQISGGQVEVISRQTGAVNGLAVDWIAGNLYWTDQEAGMIWMSDTDGRYASVVLAGVTQPKAIAVNPLSGYLYWTSPAHDSIMTARLDGSGMDVFADNCPEVDGLALVPAKNRLYWAQDLLGVFSMTLDGLDRVQDVNYRMKFNHYKDVAVFNDFITWTDGQGSVFYTDGNNQPVRAFQHQNTSIQLGITHDIIAYTSVNQPLDDSLCDSDNGGCSQLCVPMPDKTRVCKCTIGYHLASDTECVSDLAALGEYVLFADPYQKNIYQLQITKDGHSLSGRTLSSAEFPHKFDFDPQDGRVYWVDRHAHVIKYTNLFLDEEDAVVFLSEEAKISSMALALVKPDKLLYFADEYTKTMHVVKLDAKQPSIQNFNDDANVQSMVVDEEDRVLYWAHLANAGDAPTGIYSQHLDATNPQEVYVQVDPIRGLSIDRKNKRLIWSTDTSIYSMDKNGNNKKLIWSDSNILITRLTYASGNIYFARDGSSFLHRLYQTADGSWATDTVTDGVFSSITDLKTPAPTHSRFNPKTPTTSTTDQKPKTEKSTGDSPTSHLLLIAVGATAGALMLLIAVVILSILLCKHKLVSSKNKKPKPSDAENTAHDNPTYNSSTSEPVYYTLGATGGAAGGAEGTDLPDVVLPGDGDGKVPIDESQKGESPPPPPPETRDAVREEPETFRVEPEDKQLVDEDQVTVEIGKGDSRAAFKSQSSHEN